MEQRHITGKSHWYHETQSSTAEYDVLPLVPEAAKVSDPFLLDVILDEETLALLVGFLCLGVATMIYLPFVIAANKVNNMTTNG